MNNLKNTKTIERICNQYVETAPTKTEQLKALDKKVRRPIKVFAYIFGSVSALVFGTGMCLAMKVIGASLHPAIGIAVGVAGMALCGLNYLLYKKILERRKNKYSDQIIALCNEALNEENNK